MNQILDCPPAVPPSLNADPLEELFWLLDTLTEGRPQTRRLVYAHTFRTIHHCTDLACLTQAQNFSSHLETSTPPRLELASPTSF